MNIVEPDLDTAEMGAAIISQGGIVIARDIDDLRSLARLAQQLLHNVIMRLRPVPVALEPPAIKNISNEIDLVGFAIFEEFKQLFGFAAARPQMNV